MYSNSCRQTEIRLGLGLGLGFRKNSTQLFVLNRVEIMTSQDEQL